MRVMPGHECPGSGENPQVLQDAFSTSHDGIASLVDLYSILVGYLLISVEIKTYPASSCE